MDSSNSSNKEAIEYYDKSRGLSDFKLRSIEDIFEIHKIDVLKIDGYENLTDKNKELFKSFIVNFFNASGLERRNSLLPLNINYVIDTEYLGKRNESDDFFVPLGYKIYVLSADNKLHFFKQEKFDEAKYIECTEDTESQYLRFEYDSDTGKSWQHVVSPTEWY